MLKKKEIEKFIENLFEDSINLQLVSDAANVVYRFEVKEKGYYLKFYCEDGFRHKDHELLLYEFLQVSLGVSATAKRIEDSFPYLKKLIKKGIFAGYSFAVFEEVGGELLADLIQNQEKWTKSTAKDVAKTFVAFSTALFSIKIEGYGKIEEAYDTFEAFFPDYVRLSLATLATCDATKLYVELAEYLLADFLPFLAEGETGVVPMDNNFKNIIVQGRNVKFVDPGSIILGPVEMGYGEFTAHAYGTCVYPAFIEAVDGDINKEKKIRLFAIFSLMNIMAFLVRNGLKEPTKMCPFGNIHTFDVLIREHLEFVRR